MERNDSDEFESKDTPAQRAMKQTSKTAAEVEAQTGDDGGQSDQSDASDVATPHQPTTSGDAPVGQSGNDGSSPYEEPNDGRREGREK